MHGYIYTHARHVHMHTHIHVEMTAILRVGCEKPVSHSDRCLIRLQRVMLEIPGRIPLGNNGL